jgi:C-8 sterol isomerase
MCRVVIGEMARAYPGHIETRQRWVYSLAAGATGVMTVLHGSLSEYVIIFGTAIGTEGFSGRYAIEIFDVMLTGDMWTYTQDRVGEKVVTRPGEMAHLPADKVKGWRVPDTAWMLEYARGPVPTALPVALADACFSALDPVTLTETLWVYGAQVVKNLMKGKI